MKRRRKKEDERITSIRSLRGKKVEVEGIFLISCTGEGNFVGIILATAAALRAHYDRQREERKKISFKIEVACFSSM